MTDCADRAHGETSDRRLLPRLLAIAGHSAGLVLICAAGYIFLRVFGGRSRALGFVGWRLRCYLEALGPAFIKVGQLLALRRDLLPAEMLAPLRSLHRTAAPVGFAAIQSVLRDSYGEKLTQIFMLIEPIPVGVGAVAQVHRATTAAGGEVALKILKPDARALLEIDLQILRAGSLQLARWRRMQELPVVDVVNEIVAILAAQLDFRREATVNRSFRVNFKYADDVRFARLIDDLCTPSVLVMEFVQPLAPVDDGAHEPETTRRLALTGLRALYRMIFDHGLVHADMHPGNIFRCDHRMAILDTGLVAEISEQTRNDFVDFFFAVVNRQGADCADLVWRTALAHADETRRPAFNRSMIDFVDRHAAKTSGEFEITAFVLELLDIQRRHGVRPSSQFITLVLAMTVYDGVCRMLYPGCDFQTEARGYLIAARYRRQRSPSRLLF